METVRQSPPILLSKPVVTEEDALLGMVNNKLLSDFYILVEPHQSADQLDHNHSRWYVNFSVKHRKLMINRSLL